MLWVCWWQFAVADFTKPGIRLDRRARVMIGDRQGNMHKGVFPLRVTGIARDPVSVFPSRMVRYYSATADLANLSCAWKY